MNSEQSKTAENLARVQQAMDLMPLIAILRGLTPERAETVGQTLADAGFSIIEVPLNSPEPFESIRILRDTLDSSVVVGAGTVVNIDDVARVAEAGGEIVVTPNTNTEIIEVSAAMGMIPMPGFSTPTEAFSAIASGAGYLKLFPANMYPLDYVKALLSVLPKSVKLAAVGGIDASNGGDYIAAGCHGVGLGSSLFKPDMSLDEIARRAKESVAMVESGQ